MTLLVACGSAKDEPRTERKGASPTNREEEKMTAPENTLVLQTNIDALAAVINLPVRPTAAAWLEIPLGNPDNRAPGPTDYRLDAFLTYSAEEAARVLEQVGGESNGRNKTLPTEAWWPTQVLEQATEGGRISVRQYGGTSFLRSPFTQGTLSQIDGTDQFLLTLLSF